MSDALITPATGTAGFLISGSVIAYSLYKLKKNENNIQVPLMGIMGAFIFAAQMINFAIPGTGSSGHICGSLLLAVLLGPYASMVVISSVLVTQALFFADGGLMALGCNIINMGVIPCFIAFPFIYRPIAGNSPTKKRLWTACIIASIIGLQIGAFAVVLETTLSGISELDFKNFAMIILPIHIPIAFIEGLITASILTTIKESKPELFCNALNTENNNFSLKKVYLSLILLTVLTGGVISWFASSSPDGLEWAIAKTSNDKEIVNTSKLKLKLENIQEKTAFLPDYGFKNSESNKISELSGTSLSGIVGAVITLLLAIILGFTMRLLQTKKLKSNNSLQPNEV
jgi:cobalt/nickel transport system permease protein